jgi:hypothetical protein
MGDYTMAGRDVQKEIPFDVTGKSNIKTRQAERPAFM